MMAPDRWRAPGVPLHWRECKSFEYWQEVLNGLHVTAVIDLAATTMMPLACMATNTRYHGFVGTLKAKEWMDKMLDDSAHRHVQGRPGLWKDVTSECVLEDESSDDEADMPDTDD